VENVRTIEEARALALIDHLLPVLANWRRAEDLRGQLPKVEEDLKSAQTQLDEGRIRLASLTADLGGIYKNRKSYGIGPFIGIGLAVIYLVVFGPFSVGSVLMALAILGVGTFAGYLKAKSSFEALNKVKVTTEADVAHSYSSVEQCAKLRQDIDAEVNSRSGGFPEVKIASVRFGLEAAQVDGRNVLLDLSGCTNATQLKAVDVSGIKDGLSTISAKAGALLSVPPMLAPGQSVNGVEADDQLFGEELELQNLVSEFTVNLGKLRDVSLSLPLLKSNSFLVQRLANANGPNSGVAMASNGPAIEISCGGDTKADIQAFVSEVNRSKQEGVQVFSELHEVFRNLEEACNIYASARTNSINTIHQNLTEVLNRATWCGRRFYCPRTILSPRYLQDLLGIDPSKAYLLSLDDLINRLRSDPEVAKRLNDKSDLEDQLANAYVGVQSFINPEMFDASGSRMADQRRPKYIEDQFRESIKLFSNVLMKVMTGSSYPILNFSTEAQVFYDPENEEWNSDVVPYTYSTPDIIKYGSVVKAYSDLLLPLWEQLWTEKADFRKSELFRTNESMIRMSEKESEKLIEIGNQFRADMRTVRENVYLLESELQSKHSEILAFRDGMDQLGLLSSRVKEAVSDTKLAGMVVGEPVIPKMGQFEALLSMMPKSEAENRGTAHDPIESIREPEALIEFPDNVGVRLLSV
jgi:hypothetical protein